MRKDLKKQKNNKRYDIIFISIVGINQSLLITKKPKYLKEVGKTVLLLISLFLKIKQYLKV